MQKIISFFVAHKVLLWIGLLLIGAAIAYGVFAGRTPSSLPTPTIMPAQILRPSLTTSPTTRPAQPSPTLSPTHTPIPKSITPTETAVPVRTISILLDDFNTPPYPGESVYPYNRLDGNRGIVNGSSLVGGGGYITTTVAMGNSWGGAWTSLDHPDSEGLAINFSAILPAQIRPEYQSQIIGIRVEIVEGTPNRLFKLEFKNGDTVQWTSEVILEGGPQTLNFALPPLENISQLVWILDRAAGNDYVVLDRITLTTTTQITDTAMAAFVWSYGMLLNNWNPTTGLARDKAHDASGDFDAIQATGSLAAATALAEQLGIIEHEDAITIVKKISDALLIYLPRYHGLWPHFVKVTPNGDFRIAPGVEWSSMDTAIAAVGLLTAQSSLDLDTTETENFLRTIDWKDLTLTGGVSHGYSNMGDHFPYAWDVFGGESWLVEWLYSAATGLSSQLTYPVPPTANGSGFIDEMAWLFAPPPMQPDRWGAEWETYRKAAAEQQIGYYATTYPDSCLARSQLFGLSAAEVPSPSTTNGSYQAFGLGGRFAGVNDGSDSTSAPVVIPHEAGLIASIRPTESVQMYDWLIQEGIFSPLTNVESLTFLQNTTCAPTSVVWNQLKGSWNLSLQTLGWGRYLAERTGQNTILWQAATDNPLLSRGYRILTGEEPPLEDGGELPKIWTYERECESPDEYTVGQTINRSDASQQQVHGRFGTIGEAPWSPQAGSVSYTNIFVEQTRFLYLKLRYSKNSPPGTPILVFLDDENTPRATIYPTDQGNWEYFAWTEPILIGSVESGIHTIRFLTDGQQYGVADLDRFVLEAGEITLNR